MPVTCNRSAVCAAALRRVVAPPYREERVLAAMAAIEDAVSQDALYPRTPIEPLGKGK